MSTVFSGLRILAVSPMKRTPATIKVLAGWLAPKRAISSESPTQPPVSHARSCSAPSIVVGNHDGIAFLEQSLDALRRLALLLAVLLRQHPGPGLACAALAAAARCGLVEFHGSDRHRLHPELCC
jgi:hypothetical protein